MKCNYKNQYIKLGLLSIVLALFGQLFLVQVKAAVDTIGADEALGKKHVTQVPLEQCNRIDTCSVTRFAIVSKDGKLGIYDLEKHENVTEIDLDVAGFSRRYVLIFIITLHTFSFFNSSILCSHAICKSCCLGTRYVLA